MKLPRHAEIWFGPYLKDRLRKRMRSTKPKRAWVAITDHYEPIGLNASIEAALGRVAQWRDKWPRIANDAPRDSRGARPQYSFFYPQEEYRRDLLDGIAELVHLGVADVEVHLLGVEEAVLRARASRITGRIVGNSRPLVAPLGDAAECSLNDAFKPIGS